MVKDPKWIEHMHMKKGALRKATGTPAGKNISSAKLNAAAKKKGVTGERARLAKTLKKL